MKQVNFVKTLIIVFVSMLIALSAISIVTITVTSNKKRKHLEEYFAEVNRQSIAVENDKRVIANKTTTHTYVKPKSSRGFEKYYLEEETVTKPTATTTSITKTTETSKADKATKLTSTSTKTSTTTKAATKISTTHTKPTTTKTTTTTTNPNYDYEYDNMNPSGIDDIYDEDYFADDNPDITTETQENISENY